MSPTDIGAALGRIDRDEIARVCADLVCFNTTNPPGNERPAAEYLASYLAGAGFEAEFIPFPGQDQRASVVCRLPATSPSGGPGVPEPRRPALLLSGHLDVVPVGAEAWQHAPFGGEIAGGKVWGRGSSDMKGGIAAMLVAARAVALAGGPRRADLILAGTTGEEIGMTGARQVVEWPKLGPVEAIIIGEPTSNTLGLAERGALWLELTTHGQTAHSATPGLGRNAIDMMRRLLAGFDDLGLSYPRHPILGDFTCSLNMIHGGVGNNVVPDHCAASLDLRTLPGQEPRQIVQQVEELIAALRAHDAEFRATVTTMVDLPAVDTPDTAPAVQRFLAAAAAAGLPVVTKGLDFSTEAAIYVPVLHVPVLIFGPGDAALAHQPEEAVSIAAMLDAARVYASAALAWLA